MINRDDSDRINSELAADLRGAESLLQDVIASTSVDVFGTSVKSFMDRVILFSIVGLLISTIGVLDETENLGPFKIKIGYTWLVQAAISVTTLYCAIALGVLARTDFRRWSATFNLKIPEVKALGERLNDVIRRDMLDLKAFGEEIMLRIARGEFQETPEGEVPYPLKEKAKEIEDRSSVVSTLIGQIADPGMRMRRQANTQLWIFVIVPIGMGIVSFLFCMTSAIRTYLVLLYSTGAAE